MGFSTATFLFFFLPFVSALYFFSKSGIKDVILLLASILFYAWGEPHGCIVLLVVCIVNYVGVFFFDGEQGTKDKFVLFIILIFNISILLYFKYFNFFLNNINKLTSNNFFSLDLILPVGISFFIFQSMSYVIDVFRKDSAIQYNFIKLALYFTFFPKLLEGPIVQYHDIEKYLINHRYTIFDVVWGIKRFIIGLGKKVIIADSLGIIVDQIFSVGYAGADIWIAWLGGIAYTLQIYFDFSGYSDMAIGLGRMFGFRFFENFNYPYISQSITEFWRRWHISLGAWFKNYLYVPLGGNRRGIFRTYLNLSIVFFITGMWHGANWTFIIWGIWHGFFMVIERKLGFNKPNKVSSFIKHTYTILVFLIGWVMFRADTVGQGLGFLKTMFGLGESGYIPFGIHYYLTSYNIIILLIAVLASTPVVNFVLQREYSKLGRYGRICEYLYLIFVFILSISYIASSTYHPFIYFQF